MKPALLLLVLITGCAHEPGGKVWPLMHDRWVGTANETPFGTIPYGLGFAQQGDTLVAETLKPPQGDLPPAAKQKFVIDRKARTFSFEATLGNGGTAKGTLPLVAEKSTDQRLVFCSAEGCEKMEIDFEAADELHLKFITRIKGAMHSDIALEPIDR